MEEPVTHRAAVLQYATGQIQLESEAVESIKDSPGETFEAPVAYAVFIFGEAPRRSFDPKDDLAPEKVPAKQIVKDLFAEPQEQWLPHQPGVRDIAFPGVQGVPQWMLSVLRRIHVNLGPLVRHLAQAGAAGDALLAAKHLQCSNCARTKPPSAARPTKVYQARRFNDRLMMDIVFIRDVTSSMHTFLSQVDDGTTYQVLDLLETRSSEEATKVLARGWFKFFGFPDEMLLDAEGAMRGWDFEQLCAQAGVKVRFVPPDAHYQLGKAERHGQAVKHIMQRLVNQFAATTADEMQMLAKMACFAKNSLVRRSGASPCQWVYGRNPKIPNSILSEPDAIEAKQVIEDSERYRRIEEVRHQAMMEYLQFEHSEALRKAVLRKSRPWRGPVEVGAKVAYFRTSDRRANLMAKALQRAIVRAWSLVLIQPLLDRCGYEIAEVEWCRWQGNNYTWCRRRRTLDTFDGRPTNAEVSGGGFDSQACWCT
jgi:hypothetical protein